MHYNISKETKASFSIQLVCDLCTEPVLACLFDDTYVLSDGQVVSPNITILGDSYDIPEGFQSGLCDTLGLSAEGNMGVTINNFRDRVIKYLSKMDINEKVTIMEKKIESKLSSNEMAFLRGKFLEELASDTPVTSECPSCGSKDLDSHYTEAYKKSVFRYVDCEGCGVTFREDFTPSGFQIVNGS